MKIAAFVESVDLLAKSEIQKVKYIFYYYLRCENLAEASPIEIRRWFNELNLGNPNITRLMTRIKSSTEFVKGSSKTTFRLHARTIKGLAEEMPMLSSANEDITSNPTILPEIIFKTTNPRRYIVRLCEQINASYEHNLFDACAVLMRRLLEILLIHSYQHLSLESKIMTPDGSFKELKSIIVDATATSNLTLSRNTKTCLDTFRMLGNFAAHKITYNTTRDDINSIKLDFRAAVEELLYMAGLRT